MKNLAPAKKDVRPREHVTRSVAHMILGGSLKPGERLLSEAEMCAQLAVSRTALREAIRTLAGKGLVASRTRSGTVVLPTSAWNQLDPELLAWREGLAPDYAFVRALIEARQVIEPAAAALAAQRATGHDLAEIESAFGAMTRAEGQEDLDASVEADAAFHRAILIASHNDIFANFGAVIGSALRISFRMTTTATENYRLTLAKHGEVLEAIRVRDSERASQTLAELIHVAGQDLAVFVAAAERNG